MYLICLIGFGFDLALNLAFGVARFRAHDAFVQPAVLRSGLLDAQRGQIVLESDFAPFVLFNLNAIQVKLQLILVSVLEFDVEPDLVALVDGHGLQLPDRGLFGGRRGHELLFIFIFRLFIILESLQNAQIGTGLARSGGVLDEAGEDPRILLEGFRQHQSGRAFLFIGGDFNDVFGRCDGESVSEPSDLGGRIAAEHHSHARQRALGHRDRLQGVNEAGRFQLKEMISLLQTWTDLLIF